MKVLTIDLGRRTPPVVHAVLREVASAYAVERNRAGGLRRCRAGECAVAVLCVDRSGPAEARFARELRESHDGTPLLVVAGRASADDMVRALDCGADDYLPGERPPAELVARVRALGRREPSTVVLILASGGISLDPVAHRAWRNGEELALAPQQLALLEAFLRHPGRVLSRAQLLELAWDPATAVHSNVVDQAVGSLRRRIGPDRIATVHGVGYRFEEG